MPTSTAAAPGAVPADPDAVLEALDPEQREVATALTGPVCVLAGAGTGKTRAITHRIAYGVRSGVYVPQQVLAVTFTARAAGEMRTRLRGLGVGGVQARTFHAAALRQLGYFWPRCVGGSPPRIMAHKAALVAEAAGRLRLQADRAAVRDLAAEVEWAKVTMLTPEGYPEAAAAAGRGRPAGLEPVAVSRLLEVYEEVKTTHAVIDFEDVLLLTVGLVREYRDVAASVRAQYRHFVVDEYQDVSPLQQALLDLWTGGRDDLCVVGDPNQTIYSFTGATPRHLLDFRRRFPEARLVRLVRDYRSTPQVVATANAVLHAAAAAAPLELVAQREAGPEPTLTVHDDDVAEARGVATRVRRLVAAGVRASSVAVLYRTNGQAGQIEQALADAGLSYVVQGGERFFARAEVREAMLLLRGAARASDGTRPMPEEARAVLSGLGWTERAPSGPGAVRERWESLQALAGLADELAAERGAAGLADLVAELDERAAVQHAPTVEGVTLASLHAAKGLEWDVVLLVGLAEGLLPIGFAEGDEAVEEERRLFYVGVTRARRELHLSWSRSRTPGGRASRLPSRFLDGLPCGPQGRGGRSAPVRVQERVRPPRRDSVPATCRVCTGPLGTAAERKIGRCAGCPPQYDEALLQRLRDWRAREAAAAGVPAYVVLTDATLVAVAETRPADRGALARVPGVGVRKLDRYGEDVLRLLGGDDPDEG